MASLPQRHRPISGLSILQIRDLSGSREPFARDCKCKDIFMAPSFLSGNGEHFSSVGGPGLKAFPRIFYREL